MLSVSSSSFRKHLEPLERFREQWSACALIQLLQRKKKILTSNRAPVQIISEFITLKKHRMDKHLNRQLRVEAAVGF